MNTRRAAALILVAALHAAPAWAGTEASTTPANPVTLWDRLPAIPTIYRNPENPLLQELAFTGQMQTQYAYGSDDSGKFGTAGTAEDAAWGNIEVRRLRLGIKARMFGKLSFLNLTELYPDLSPRFYKRTPETHLTWTENPAFSLSLGKSELKFDREQEYSSKEFPLFERTALGNMFYGGELTGLWAGGKGIAGAWLYQLGIFSNDRRDEWSEFEGGAMLLAKLGFNYSARAGLDLAEVKLQLLHNTEPGFTATSGCGSSPLYSTCVSVSNELQDGPFGLTTEFLWGDGDQGRPDVAGVSAMPFWNLTEKLQLIGEFEFAASRGDNGVFLPSRYEALSPGAGDRSGDRYAAAYAGLTYFIHGHNLKLMSGAKYSHLEGGPGGGDFNGWTWLAGLRAAF